MSRNARQVRLMHFRDALADASECTRRHLLLGNGFSIACRPNIFVYGKLFEQADFTKMSPSAKRVFMALDTQDFEKVIKVLRDARTALAAYSAVPRKLLTTLQNDAEGLRELLVQTIAASHPAWPGEIREVEYTACRNFLAQFDNVYTLNYDLLLYWAQMHTINGAQPSSDDGFRKPDGDFDAAYVTWESGNSHKQNTWFLHGALHLFDAGTEIQKYTWCNTGVRLVDQIRDALEREYFPIFVSEGTSDEKLTRIRHNDYLAKAFRSFTEITGALFIYGHSLAPNDEHFLKRIEKGKLGQLYVGIYGDPDSPQNKAVVQRAKQMDVPARKKSLLVRFFDAETAKVWQA